MMPLVVAWFCECGSVVRMSFCAAHLRVTACAGSAARAAAAASAARARWNRMGFLLSRPIIHKPSETEAPHDTDPGPARVVRPRRLPVLSPAVQRRRDQDPDRRGARALRAAAPGERTREDRRCGSYQLRGAHVQRAVRAPGAPPAHGRADKAALR